MRRSACRSGHLGSNPAEVVAWVRRYEIPVAPRFERVVSILEEKSLLSPIAPAKPPKVEVEPVEHIHHLTRSGLYRMIFALAAGGNESFTEIDVPRVVKKVVDWAHKCGLTLDDETAQKYLREAIKSVA